MRLLSVRPPYAQAIFWAGKSVENRSWSTDYRGIVYVHASLRIDHEFFYSKGFKSASGSATKKLVDAYMSGQIFGGMVLGSVELVDVVENARSAWAVRGQYHWLLKNPRLLRGSVVCKGKLQLWQASATLQSQIRKAA